jgi:hypothetical protein
MSDFEKASLALAQQQYHLGVWSTVISGLALLAAVFGAIVIYGQLKSARWMALLTLEQDMAARRDKFLNIKDRLKSFPNDKSIETDYEVLKESYLNAVERLSSSILNGNFPEKEMKQDYREYIADVMRTCKSDFHAATPYRKTQKLYNKWQD